MNAKHFQRLNPHFKFNRIFLFNQTKFYSEGNLKKFLFPLNKVNSNNKYILELKEEKNLDYLTQKLISHYRNENKEKNEKTQSKSKKMKEIRSKLVKNNNILKQIDFYINNKVSDIKNESFELDINPYHNLSPKINTNKRTINITENNNILNQRVGNKNNISDNKSYEGMKTELDNLKLPYINTDKNRRRFNLSSFNKNMEYQKNRNDNITKNSISYDTNNNIEVKKDIQRDIFKNINYLIDNKKTQININDIKRNIYDFKNLNDNEEESKKFDSKLFINTKIPKSFEKKSSQNLENDKNEMYEDNKFNEEIMKIREKEKYIIYEQNKKYIDKNKIYDAMKYGAANIPNLSLDKGFKEVKKFEKNVLDMKRTRTDLPVFIKTKQIN